MFLRRFCCAGLVAVLFYVSDVRTQTATQPTSSARCEDVLDNCAAYGSEACKGQYLPWATHNCRKTCNLCVATQPTSSARCEDVLDNCAAYGSEACKGQYLPWATHNCRKTCNLCACVDRLENCHQYGQYVCFGRYEKWARDHCAKTCGYCDHSAEGFQNTAQPNPSCAVPAGQILLMKAVAGAPGDVYQLWSSPNTANDNLASAKTLDSHVVSHYKSRLVNNLDTCDFDTIKVSIYKDCVERASLTFDARHTARSDWFTASRLVASSFGDLSPSSPALFHMAGAPSTGREWYVGGAESGCDGRAWFFVSTRTTCPLESQGATPGFYYASGHTSQPLQPGYLESGDVLAIVGQGGSCSQGQTTSNRTEGHDHRCVFKGHRYQQGQWWQDGCQRNCTCVDGPRGFYQCHDLCVTYTNLPPNCPLIRDPSACCPKPSCMDIAQNGCMYKNVVYQEGQTWNDGCDYKCTCKDGSSGRYQCTTRCLQFQLPPQCHMDPAPAGKCCPVPACPANIHVHLPDGYTSD